MPYLSSEMMATFLPKRVRIPNRLRTLINPGSNGEGYDNSDGNENVKRNEPNK